MIWLVVIIGAAVLPAVIACWAGRHLQAGTPDEPVPYWPASTNPCTWCKPAPQGLCTCTSVCGHVRCVGDHTSLSALTAADMRWLREQTIRGHE